MEGSWQDKRVSPRPPATPIHQFPTLQSRNQIHEGVVGQHMHPYPTQHVHANDGALREGSLMFDTLNLGHSVFDFKSAKTVAANNFQSLVSASPQQQCEVAAYPLSSMTSVATFPLPNLESSVPAKDYSAVAQGPSLMSWFLQPHGSDRIKIDETPCPVVSVKDLPPTACTTVSLPHDVSQTRNSFFGGLDLSRSASYHATTKNGMGSKGSDIHCPSSETTAHIFHHTKGAFSQQFSKASADFDGVSPVSTHATMRGCPRVFCLNTSGVLLLSDTGHLGVVCSCHNLHMSVENFTQHSGSCGVDPGDAIRLENGVSLRQWRKHSFPMLGIKVLDDNGGWDWPDWNIINHGSLGAMPSYIQNTTKISHLTKDVNAFSRTRNSNQPCSDLTVPTSFLVQRSKNPTDCLGQDALEKYSYGGRDMMKNLFGSAHGPTTIFPDGQNILASEGTQSEISRKSYPDEAGKHAYRHLAEYLDILSKCGNPRAGPKTPNQIAENAMPSNSDFTGNRTPPQLFISRASSPSPSHVELKLGQSSELSRPCVSSVYFKSQPMDGLTTKKFVSCDQPRQQGLDHFLLSSQPGSSTNKLAEKERSIYHKRHEPGSINGNNNQMNDQVGRSSPLMTMLCSPIVHHDSHDGGRLSGDTSKLVSSTEQLMSGLLGADSQVDICELDDCGKWKIVYPDQSDLAVVSKDSLMGTDISSNGLFNSSSLPTPFRVARSPALPDRSCAPIDSDFHMQHITDVSNPTPDAKTSVPVGFRSFAGGDDRSATPAAFRLSPLPASTQSTRNTTSLPNLKSTLQGENVIHSRQINFGENPRLLALKDMVMHNCEGPNIELYQDNGQLYGCSPMRLQRNEREETMMRPKLDKGTVLVGKQDNSKVYIHSHSCRSYCSGVGCSKPCCLAGAKNTWNLCMPQEITVKDASSRSCCFNHGPFDQPLLRLGRAMHDFRRASDQHLHCHQRESNSCYSGNLGCFGQLRCLAGNCCSRLGGLYEHTDHASSSSCVHGSVLDRGSYSPNMVINQHIHHQSLVGQLPGKSKLDSLETSLRIPGEVINAEQEVECILQNNSMNNPCRAPAGSSLNEQKMSNICSEESAPSITDCSVSSDNLRTSDVLNAGVKFGSIIDEESRIKRSISSCDATDSERAVDATLFARKIDPTSWNSSKTPGGKSDNVCAGDRLRDSTKLITEKKKNSLVSNPSGSDTRPTPVSNDLKTENKGSVFKWKKFSSARHLEDSPVVTRASEKYKSPCHHIEDSLPLHEHEITSSRNTGSGQTTLKRKRSMLPSSGSIKKMLVHVVDLVDGDQLVGLQKAKRTTDTPKIGAPKVLSRKKTIFNLKRVVDCSLPMDGVSEEKVHRKRNCNLFGHASVSQEIDPINHESKHTLSGNCRIITNGKLSDGFPKPLKFGSLSLILKTAKECTITEAESTNFSFVPKNRMEYGDENSRCSLKRSTCKNEDTEVPPCSFVIGEDHFISMDQVTNEFNARKVRKLSLCELSEKLKASHGRHEEVSAELDYRKKSDMEKAACQVVIALDKNRPSTGKSNCSADIYDKKNTKWTYHSALKYSARLHTGNERERRYVIEHFQKHPTRTSKRIKRKKSVLDTEASCSVCRNKDSDAGNVLLECAGCLIKVHQACYGVLKLPKGRWCCRPCRTDSNEIACVLCGYQGGAMTRALRSQRVVKSLLRAWNVLESPMNKVCVSQTKDDEFTKPNSASVNEGLGKEGSSMEFMKTCNKAVNIGKKSSCGWRDSNIGFSNGMRSDVAITNTITDTLLNPNTKQWVHMVCGLWMPGTRCPNVDTMSAFDVSGVPCLKKKKVCSLCRRPGGSCIKCRVVDCRVMFHPWCAHQKGLLQNETEGDNNQNIGFYGRCLLHSRDDICDAAPTDPLETETSSSIQNKDHPKDDNLTCARTEGYKGRKKEEGFQHCNVHLFSSESGGCMVPQEQINAWLHINGLKSCVGKPFLASDVEHDSRKEYVRYKQAKGWKNLVVYKSGIHALGLYTSQFIPRGAMVVEYVGEIVGSRVADKREAKYLSGKGVQYKSACYFFRIDREQIIDATQKGGIARFVNHSCQPNCVAKIISIRNEKKVVFFAERAINPGEEITYDYHFNHEDEGKKIPCFCNSKNCRRYLN